MIARELEEKYKVSIVNFTMSKECPETCQCGHHISEHFGQGSAGGCRGCGDDQIAIRTFAHSFTPFDYRVE